MGVLSVLVFGSQDAYLTLYGRRCVRTVSFPFVNVSYIKTGGHEVWLIN